MKRAIQSFLVVCFSLLTLSPSVLAVSNGVNTSLAESQIKTTVEEYLKENTNSIYLQKENDTSSNTICDIAEIPDVLNVDSHFYPIQIETLESFIKGNQLPLAEQLGREEVSLVSMLSDIELMDDRTAYFSHIYNAQDITYSYFTSDYIFDGITAVGDYATVDVYEVLNYQYSFCDEPTYERIRYNLALVYLDGQWVIADVISDDPFYQTFYGTDFDLETEIAGYDEANAPGYVALPVADDAMDVEPVYAVSAQSEGGIAYIPQNAVNYALTYTTSDDTGDPSFKNERFPWFNADCQNFASQCVWAGFGGSNSTSDIQAGYGMDKVGTESAHTIWWANSTSGTNSWASCRNFRLYVTASSSSSGRGLKCDMIPTAYNDNTLEFPADDLIGAILHVEGRDGGSYVAGGHAVFVNNATGNTRDSIYICAYNNTAKNKLLSTAWPATTGRTTAGITAIVPRTFQQGETGTRLWADLQNVFVDKTATRTLKGYSNEILDSLQMVVYNPNGVPVVDWTVYDTDSIIANYNQFTVSGEWSIKLVGKTYDGQTLNWWYTIRVK